MTLCPDATPQERTPNKKTKSPFPCAYLYVPPEPTPYPFVLIHPVPNHHGY
jgi:hypothetical protein